MSLIEVTINRSVEVVRSARVKQLEGLFDVPPAKRAAVCVKHRLELPAEWNIGVIVGPSGAGKTTLAREAFPEGFGASGAAEWPGDRSILDGFPAGMGIKEITLLLSSVGFSSPPAWVKPFAVLSNGEQFRVNLARTLAESAGGSGTIAVVDEFSSVVDRTVAQIGSAAVAKTVRRRGRKFVAVTCHYDVLDWLEPDWVYEPHLGKLTLNSGPDGSRGLLWRRPTMELVIRRVDRNAWRLFKPHHYLNGDLHNGSKCFVGFYGGQPACFTGVLFFPHPKAPCWREHRTVCLPDFQGVGLGNAMSEFVAGLFVAGGRRYRSVTGNPAMIRHRDKSPFWRMIRRPSLVTMNAGKKSKSMGLNATVSNSRLTASFEFIGPGRVEEAKGFGVAA